MTTKIGPRGLAVAIRASSWIQPSLLRDGAQKVTSTPSRMRRPPYTQVLSVPREYSRGALMRCPSGDQPGAGGKVRGSHRAELVGADRPWALGRVGVEADDRAPFWGELRIGAGRPGAGMRASAPPRPAGSGGPGCGAPDALGAGGCGQGVQRPLREGRPPRRPQVRPRPSGWRTSRPGGVDRAKAMICERSTSVSRRGRPGIGRSPSPSRPSALNRVSRSRTVCGWQPSSAAIAVVCSPAS